jgi:tetratricopeptide (TPR) repeat protein
MATAEQLKEQGLKLFYDKDYEAAARVFNQALDAYTSEGKADMSAEMQVNLGLIHRALGEHQQSLELMKAAMNTFEQMNDQLRTAMVLGNIGGTYSSLGDKEQAYNCYRLAADLFEALGEKKLYGETMLAMASLQIKEGKLLAGAATYEVGLENLDSLSAQQKIIRSLLSVRNRFLGGGETKK